MAGFDDLIPEAMPYLAKETIEATAGASWEWSYELVDNNDDPIPWTGVTATAAMYATKTGGTPVLTFAVDLSTAGTVTISASTTDTEPIVGATYYHEIELTKSSPTRKVKIVGSGDSKIRVRNEVAP